MKYPSKFPLGLLLSTTLITSGFISSGVFAATADEFECSVDFTSTSEQYESYQETLKFAAVRMPIGAQKPNKPGELPILLTRGYARSDVIRSLQQRTTVEFEYQHATQISLDGEPLLAAQSLCIRPSIAHDGMSYGFGCLRSPASFDGIAIGWTRTDLLNGTPVFTTERSMTNHLKSPIGQIEVECKHVRTIP